MNKGIKKWLLAIIILLSLLCIGYVVNSLLTTYHVLYERNVKKDFTLYVATGSSMQSVLDSIAANGVLRTSHTFLQAIEHEEYKNVRPGHYRIKAGMNNSRLVRMLKLGLQEPVNVVIAGNIRSNEKLAAVLARSVEPDSAAFHRLLSDPAVMAGFGYTPETVIGMIIPNTYQVYWSTTADELLQRLYKEYTKF